MVILGMWEKYLIHWNVGLEKYVQHNNRIKRDYVKQYVYSSDLAYWMHIQLDLEKNNYDWLSWKADLAYKFLRNKK